jgi:arsenite methyltransferase
MAQAGGLRYVFAVLLLSMAVYAQVPHQHHPPQSAEEYAKILEEPTRDAWQKPLEVIQALELKPTDVVADIGAGSGYFSRRFAIHAAKVYAVDIDEGLLKIAAKNAPENMVTLLSPPDDPKLPPASVDLVFFCDVLHHIDNRPAYYAKLRKALKPGGRIVNVDFYKKPLPLGPPLEMKLAETLVVDEFKAAGFRLVKNFDFLPYQYFQVFN